MRTIVKSGEESIYAKLQDGEHFSGPRIPFGALVRATPSKIHDKRRKKLEHTMQPAVFLGYVVRPGCAWYREFRYVFLECHFIVLFVGLGRVSRSTRAGGCI